MTPISEEIRLGRRNESLNFLLEEEKLGDEAVLSLKQTLLHSLCHMSGAAGSLKLNMASSTVSMNMDLKPRGRNLYMIICYFNTK